MSSFAVLLESFSRLPHLRWGSEIATLLRVHRQDALTRLRRQQGIVWEGLNRDKADKLGSFLIERGYPAGLVTQEDIAQIGKPDVIRNGDVVEDGFEVEGLFGRKSLIETDSIALAQAGWVREKIEVSRTGSSSTKSPKYDMRGARYRSFNYSSEIETQTLGWVLQIFAKGEPARCTRVVGSFFNYDYQGMTGGHLARSAR